MSSNPRKQLNEYLSQIVIRKGRVADVGCSNKPNSRMCGVFEPDEYIKFDVGDNPEADEKMDLNKEYKDIRFKDYFDYVFCTEVWEYMLEPQTGANNLYHITKPGGVLFLSAVFIYPHHGKDDYMRPTDIGLNEWFTRAGFTNIEFFERKAAEPELLRAFYSSEEMHSNELRSKDYNFPVGYFMRAEK